MIRVSEAAKRYGQQWVVDKVSLEIPKGGLTSIIGPNGAGKSTLLSLISRLLPMDGGSITVDGQNVVSTPTAQLAKKLSILRQENSLTVRLTVRELVTLGRFPHCQGRPTAVDIEHVEEALDFLHLREFADRFLDQLSGGQRQRAFVAMVLCQDTDYVLLDEPLNNLDMKHAVAMMGQLRRAADELGKTIIIVLHDINFAAAYADRIVALAGGEVSHVGTPDEIMQPEVLEEIFGTPMQVLRDGEYPVAVYFR